MMTGLNRLVKKTCDWLAQNTSPHGFLAHTAIAAAGVPLNVHLPVDRRHNAKIDYPALRKMF